uniref:C-type lectin domain-containing protein n=1 Tax=Paramormyrops kingsleyae TaxID=1676925 RepID=A0A3B3RFC1_9TELE
MTFCGTLGRFVTISRFPLRRSSAQVCKFTSSRVWWMRGINPMAWEEALEYCRNHYQDLVSLASKMELTLALQKARNVQGMHFWTGLRFLDDSWLWVDGEPLTNGSWSADPLPKCPAEPFRCGALSTTTGSQEVRSCEEQLSYICYVE